MHAMTWMVDEESDSIKEFYTGEASFVHNWLLPMRRGLLAPYAVKTVDQAMIAVMFIKYGVLRLLGLSGKAMIIDEIHAYDTYMQDIMERLLEWCILQNYSIVSDFCILAKLSTVIDAISITVFFILIYQS